MASPKISVQFLGDARQFDAVAKNVQKSLQQTGLVAEKSSKSVGQSYQKTAQGISSSWSLIGQSFSSVNAPLGQFAVILPQLSQQFQEVGNQAKTAAEKGLNFQRLGAVMVGVGAGVTALGVLFETFASKEETAFADFRTAVENTGNSVDDFKTHLEEASTKMAVFGHDQSDVTEALSKLVVATQDPNKAFKDLAIAADYAARKHTTLSDAAGQLARVYAGGAGVGRVLRAFGIDVKSLTDTQGNLTKAHKEVAKATEDEARAKQRLADFYERVHAKGKVTKLDLLEEKKLQRDVSTASENHVRALRGVASAQQAVHDKGSLADQALAAFEKRAGGAASAQAQTFGGHLRALVADAENVATAIGKHVGPVLVVLGPLLATAGGLMQLMAARHAAAAAAAAVQGTAEAGLTAEEAAQIGVTDANVASTLALVGAYGEATVATSGFAASLGAAAAAAAPFIAIAAAVGASLWGIHKGLQETKKANEATNNSFLKDTIPTLLQTGNTFKITAAQWRSGPFGGSDINKARDILHQWSIGVLDTATAFQKLGKVAGVTHAQIVQAASGLIAENIQLGKQANDWYRFGQTAANALKTGVLGVSDIAKQLQDAHLKATDLKKALASIPGVYSALINLQIQESIHGVTKDTGVITSDKVLHSQALAGLLPKPTTTTTSKTSTPQSNLTLTPDSSSTATHHALTEAQRAVKSALNALAKTLRDLVFPTGDFKAQLTKLRAETIAVTAKAVEAQKQGLLSSKVVSKLQAFNRESGALIAKLESLQHAMADFNQNVAGGFNKLLDISNSFTSSITATQIQTNIGVQLQQAQQLSSFLSKAAKLGVSSGILSQAASAGPEAIPFLRALSGLSADQIKMLNAEQAKIAAMRQKTIAALDKQYFGPAFDSLAKKIHKLVSTFEKFIIGLRAVLHKAFPTIKFHTGGIVPGYPGQEVPIMALAGERVLTAQQQRSGYSLSITGPFYITAPDGDAKTLSREFVRELAKQLHRFNQHLAV